VSYRCFCPGKSLEISWEKRYLAKSKLSTCWILTCFIV